MWLTDMTDSTNQIFQTVCQLWEIIILFRKGRNERRKTGEGN